MANNTDNNTHKFRVFTQVTLTVEKEIEAKNFDEAYEKMRRIPVTDEDFARAENAEEVIFAAEDTATGEYYDYAN